MPKSATREGIANRLRRWADSAVVEGRFFVALAIIGGLVGDFVGVLVDPHFPAISGIELALAIGTLALAYSAALQAVVALQKRRDDLLSHLDLLGGYVPIVVPRTASPSLSTVPFRSNRTIGTRHVIPFGHHAGS